MQFRHFLFSSLSFVLVDFYSCCPSFRPDGIGTVTIEEKERFEEIKERLRVLLENQITHFRYREHRMVWSPGIIWAKM